MTDDLPFVHRFQAARTAHAPTLVLLHGTGGDEHDLLPLGRVLASDAALLSPRGAVSEQGKPRFFRRLAEGVFDMDDLARRAHELADFLRAAAERYDLDRSRMVAVGFSNGANIAAALMLLGHDVLRGGLLFAPMVPIEPQEPADLSGVGAFIAAGRADPVAAPEQAERLAQVLADAGAAVELSWHAGGHQLDREQVGQAREWLAKLVASTAGDGGPPLP